MYVHNEHDSRVLTMIDSNLIQIRSIFFLTLLLLLSSCSQIRTDSNEWKTAFKEIQKKWVPDTRVGVFEFIENEEQDAIIFKTDKSDAVADLQSLSTQYGLNASIKLIPTQDFTETPNGIVILSVGNIRSKPGHAQELSTQTLMGTPLRLLEKRGGWIRVQTPDLYIGWTEDDTFIRVTDAELKTWIESEKVVFTENAGLLFENADLKSAIVTDVSGGNIFKKIKTGKNFTQVALADGRTGWIPNASIQDFVQWKNKSYPNAQELLATASRFMGVPYLWGGTSFKGVDCSGFTKMAFFSHGIQLPRDASQQVFAGTPVETDTTLTNLEPGDLLFFGDHATETKPEKVTHVGIYMGDGYMIHSSGRVRIESLKRGEPTFTEYRLKTFLKARRMLNSVGSDGVIPIKNLLY